MSIPPPLPPLPDDVRASLPETVSFDGITIEVDRYGWSRGAIGAVLSGTYEYDERKLVSELLQNGDTVIEMGTGLGLVAMAAKRRCGSGSVTGFEANPEMIEAARRNIRRNAIAVELNHKIIVNSAVRANYGDTVHFKIGDNFLTSAVAPVYPVKAEIEVPVAVLEDTIAKHRADVLVIDIEGDELNLLKRAALAPVKLIICEIHFDVIGAEGFCELAAMLAAQRLTLDWGYVRGSTFAFRRRAGGEAEIPLHEYSDAVLAESGSDMAAAAEKFVQLAKLVPGSQHLTLAAARCMMAAKNYAGAVALLEDIGWEHDGDPDAAMALGTALLRMKQFAAMEIQIRKRMSKGVQTPALWALLGRGMARQSKLHAAQNCFKKSIAANPTVAAVHAALALVQRRLGLAEEAALSSKMAEHLGLATAGEEI